MYNCDVELVINQFKIGAFTHVEGDFHKVIEQLFDFLHSRKCFGIYLSA